MQRRSNNLARQRLREQAERRPTHCPPGVVVGVCLLPPRQAGAPSWWHGGLVFHVGGRVDSSRAFPPRRLENRDGRKGAEDPRGDLPLPVLSASLRMRSWEKHKAYCGDSLSPTGTSMLRRNSRRRSETDRRPAQVGSSLSRQTPTQ
jgi:hypothetical protein